MAILFALKLYSDAFIGCARTYATYKPALLARQIFSNADMLLFRQILNYLLVNLLCLLHVITDLKDKLRGKQFLQA